MAETCTIRFDVDAYDWAHQAYEPLVGLTVRVLPAEGPLFTAELKSITDGHEREDGQFIATFAVHGDHARPTGEERALNIYTDVLSITVL